MLLIIEAPSTTQFITVKIIKMSKKYLKLPEAALYLHVAKSSLYKMTSARSIPFYKPHGKNILFDLEDLDQYLTNSRIPTKTEIETQLFTPTKSFK